MINLNAILNYQQTDLKLKKLTDEIDRSEASRKLDYARTEFNAAKQTVSDCESAASSVVGFIGNAEEYLKENSARAEELIAKLESAPDEEKREIIAQLETLKYKFSDLEKKVAERKTKSDRIIKEYALGQEKGKKMRELHGSCKQKLDAVKQEKLPEINELSAKLAELKKEIPADIMAQYDSLAAEKKYPPFVEAFGDGKTYTCRGCGLELSLSNKSELNEKGICRCETCRRIIYKKP